MKISDLLPWRKKSIVPTSEGFLDTSWDQGWWQQDKKPYSMGLNETVEACVSTLSQTVAMCPVHHLVELDDGSRERRKGSNAEHVLLNPNSYQSRSQFFNDAIRSIYLDGNAYALVKRDDRRAVSELHLMNPKACRGYSDPETGEIFYHLSPRHNQGGYEYRSAEDWILPARDVLHLRINTGQDPLRGESPILAAANSIAANSAIVGHQAGFFSKMSRPSGVLTTDAPLTKEQMSQLREAWKDQSTKLNSGELPILAHGIKFQAMSLTSQDAQLVEAYGMTVAGISRVFRVPLPMINDMTGSTFNNAESLMTWFLASGLGFLLEHTELELGRLFGLPFRERLNFDTTTLLRSDWKARIETLGEGTVKGIYSPNEARAKEGLPPVPGGETPRVQQQVVPLDWEPEPNAPAPVPDDAQAAAAYAGITKAMESYANARI